MVAGNPAKTVARGLEQPTTELATRNCAVSLAAAPMIAK
jgi:hypothetical protein